MREVNDSTVRTFNEIVELYPDDYLVVEVVNIDYNIGEEIGIVLGLCDSFGEAWDAKCSLKPRDTIVVEGLHRMSIIRGFEFN